PPYHHTLYLHDALTIFLSAEIHPLRRSVGGRSLADPTVVCHLHQLVHTAHDNRFVHRVGGDRIELYRTLGLRCEYGRFAACFNHFGRVLDVALGARWPRAFYSYDRVFSCDGATCSTA